MIAAADVPARGDQYGLEVWQRIRHRLPGREERGFLGFWRVIHFGALQTVADALTAHGFAAHAESRDGRLRIISEHCPFGDAAIEHPVICAVDRGLVKGMLSTLYGEASTATESSVAFGDDTCVTAVDA